MNPLSGIGLGAAGIGALGKMFGGGNDDEYRKRLEMMYGQYGGRTAPQAGPASQATNSDFRGNQRDLVDRLDALSRGHGPSLAAQQFRQATDQNMKSQQAMAASGRGGPLAAFNAAGNMGQLGAQAAQGTALARTNEQMQALGQLGGVINQGRTNDEATNQFNTLQTNYREKDNLEARLRTMGYNDEMIRNILMQQGALAGKPSVWDQLLAGGAGMAAMGFAQAGNQKPRE